MNKTTIVAIGLVFAIVASFVLEQFFSPPTRRLHETLLSAVSVPEADVRAVQKIIGTIATAAGEKRVVSVNETFSPDAINVVLADFDSLDRERFDLPMEGMQAFPPNLLIVDMALYRNILLQAFNDSFYLAQLLGSSDSTEDSDGSTALMKGRTMGALSLQLRLSNLTHREQVDAHVANLVSKATDAFELADHYAPAFVFPIAHELWHLRARITPQISAENEEREADEFALRVANQVMSDAQRFKDKERVYAMILTKQLVLVGIRYFQDKIIEDVFRDFRGMDPSSLFVSIYHKGCEDTEAVDWPQRFNNPGVVLGAEELMFPLMSSAEFSGVAKRLDRFENAEHEHLLKRVARMAEAIAEDEVFANSAEALMASTVLYKMYSAKRADVAYIRPEASLPPFGNLAGKTLLSRLQAKQQALDIDGCADEACALGFVGKGYVEVFQRDGKIRLASIVQPAGEIDGVAALSAAAQEFVGWEKSLELIAQVSGGLGRCGVSTAVVEGEHYSLLARTMNEDGWVELRAIAQESAPSE